MELTIAVILLAGAVGAKPKEDVRYCYECSSKSALCRQTVYDGQYLTKQPCSTPCFQRREGTRIYRGCFDGWEGGLVNADYTGCRIQEYLGERIEWCFCDTTENSHKAPCNGASRDAMAKMALTVKENNSRKAPSPTKLYDVTMDYGGAEAIKDDVDNYNKNLLNTVFSTKYFVPTPTPSSGPYVDDISNNINYDTLQYQEISPSEVVHTDDDDTFITDKIVQPRRTNQAPTGTADDEPRSTLKLYDEKVVYGKALEENSMSCFSCHDSSPYCKERISRHDHLTIEGCRSKCFIRKDYGKIYRGCFDGWTSTSVDYSYEGCRKQYYLNQVVEWCFCKSDLCNKAAIGDFAPNDPPKTYQKEEPSLYGDVVERRDDVPKQSDKGSPSINTVVGMCRGYRDGVYADPYDCTRFVHCFNGFTYRRLCPPGTVWNPTRANCDYPYNSGSKCLPRGYGESLHREYQQYSYGTK